MNYNKRSESASVRPYRNRGMAPLFASKESRIAYISTSVAPLFASKESRFAYILTSGKVIQMSVCVCVVCVFVCVFTVAIILITYSGVVKYLGTCDKSTP